MKVFEIVGTWSRDQLVVKWEMVSSRLVHSPIGGRMGDGQLVQRSTSSQLKIDFNRLTGI